MTSIFSIRGECSGKVRSTPTPYEIRRTVNEARPPSPRLRITTPSNTCVRSFSPSTTRTCTRTVSPGAKPWRSFLSCPASTNRMASMTVVLQIVGGLPPFESFDQRPLVRREPGASEEVRPPPPRQPQRLTPAPPRDARVIPRQEHRGHARAHELLRPRVLRRLEEPARERLAGRRLVSTQRPRQEPGHRVRDHE